MEEKIEVLRKKIDEVDLEILNLLGKRMLFAGKIAAEKKKKRLPILQKNREKEAISERVKIGKKLRLKPIFTKKLFLLLFRESKRIQHGKVKYPSMPPALTKEPDL